MTIPVTRGRAPSGAAESEVGVSYNATPGPVFWTRHGHGCPVATVCLGCRTAPVEDHTGRRCAIRSNSVLQ